MKDMQTSWRGLTIWNTVWKSWRIKEVCEKYDVPVMFTLSGMDPSLSEVRTQYMPDGLHPNAAGHEKIAAIIAKSLEGILVGK
mgnify:CR=1 FL=1